MMCVDDGDRVTAVAVRALRAPGPACPVPGGDGPVLAAGGARLAVPHAGRAAPVLAAAPESPDLPAALRAGRQRHVPGARIMQGDEQFRDGPGRRRPAVAEHPGPPGQREGQAA